MENKKNGLTQDQKRVTAYVRSAKYKKIKAYALANDISQSKFLNIAIDEMFQNIHERQFHR